ncbi:MAG: hypothetical protein ACNA8K_17255 [Cyclonatronaceae bacterium]
MGSEKTLSTLTPEDTIKQIISSNRKVADLLTSIGMKPEQYENQSLRSACQQLQWNEEELLDWIKKHHQVAECIESEPKEPDFGNDIVKWCDWLSVTVEPRIHKLLTEITKDLPRVQLVHGNQYTWLKEIEWYFNTMKKLLELYLSLEKKTLFPLAKELNQQGESISYGRAKDLKRSLEILNDDKSKIVKELNRIRDFSSGFEHPAGSCTTLRIMNKNMENLDSQLRTYFSTEENHIFPVVKKQLKTA